MSFDIIWCTKELLPLGAIIVQSLLYGDFQQPNNNQSWSLTHPIFDSDVHDLDCVMITFGFHVLLAFHTTERENSFSEIVSMSRWRVISWAYCIIEIEVWEQICGEIPRSAKQKQYDKWSSEKRTNTILHINLRMAYRAAMLWMRGLCWLTSLLTHWNCMHFNHIICEGISSVWKHCAPQTYLLVKQSVHFQGICVWYNWHNNQRILPNGRWDGIRVIKIRRLLLWKWKAPLLWMMG